jgi:hypothetical protein
MAAGRDRAPRAELPPQHRVVMEEQWERPMECERRRRRRPQETTQEPMCDQLAGDAGDDGVHPGENVGTGDDTRAWRLGGAVRMEMNEAWRSSGSRRLA